MSDNTLETTEATEASTTQTQAQQSTTDKTYTQKEVDDMMARMKTSLKSKLLKPYEELGDVEELRQLRAQAQKQQEEQMLKRGEFDKIMQELASKKDAEISKRDAIIKEYKVNTPLLSAAAQYQAINAEQVRQLLAPNVRMNAEGEVEVVDSKGSVRYNDKGEPLGVADLVREFLDSNPHFRAPTPATTNTKSNIAKSNGAGLDLSSLDMKNPVHRKLYAEAKAAGKIK